MGTPKRTAKKPAKKPAKRPAKKRAVEIAPKGLSGLPVLWSVGLSGQAVGFHLGETEVWGGWDSGEVAACSLEGKVLRRWKLPAGVDAVVADEFWRYAGCRDGNIYDLTGDRPSVMYAVDPNAHIQWIDICRGVLFASDSHGACTSLDVKQSLLWKYAEPGGNSGWMVRADGTGVFLGNSAGVTRFDADGTKLWHTTTAWVGFGVLGPDRVYVITGAWGDHPAFLALDRATGKVEASGDCRSVTAVYRSGMSAASCAASPDGERLFAAVRDTLFCFDRTGALQWEVSLQCGTPCSMGYRDDRLYVATHLGQLACLDVSEAAVARGREGAAVQLATTQNLAELAETSREVPETTSAEGGVLVECVRVGTELRVRVITPGYHDTWFVQFPRDLREEGARFVVDAAREASQGGFYRVHGNIRRLRT